MSTLPGCPGGSTNPQKPTEIDFLGLGCCLETPSSQNPIKKSQGSYKKPFYGGFWLLGTVKLYGCIQP